MILKKTLEAILSGLFLALALHYIPVKELISLLPDSEITRNAYTLLVIAAACLFMLALPFIYKYGAAFEDYIKRTPKFYSHELDSLFLTTLIFLIGTIWLNQEATLLENCIEHAEKTYRNFYIVIVILIYGSLYLGLPTKKTAIREILRLSALLYIIHYYNLPASITDMADLKVEVAAFFSFCLAFVYAFPWTPIRSVFNFIKNSNFNFIFGRNISNNPIYIKNIKRYIKNIKWKQAIALLISILKLLHNRLWKNYLPIEDKQDKQRKFAESFADFVGAKHGQTAEDKVYRYTVSLMRDAYGYQTPHITTDQENAPADVLNRKAYIGYLYKLITDQLNSGKQVSNVTFGLYGAWGEGKSFVVGQLIQKIENQNPHIICVVTHPWHSLIAGDRQNAIEHVISDIEYKLFKDIRSLKLRRKLRQYAQGLAGHVKTGVIDINLHLSNKDNIQDVTKDINNEIAKYDKKLLIVFEDIDRLNKQDALACFQLMRALELINNTVCLVPCNKRKMEELVQYSENDTEYTQKFIQFETYLPPINKQNIKDYVYEELKAYWVETHNFDENDFQQPLRNVLDTAEFEEIITNMRHAKRLESVIKLRYTILKDEVNLEDLFELEMVKQNCPELYDNIYRNSENYIIEKASLSIRVPSGNRNPYEILDENFQNLIENIRKNFDNNKKLDAIARVIRRLFPSLSYTPKIEKRKFRVCDLLYYDVYFKDEVPSNRLKNADIDAVTDATLAKETQDEERDYLRYCLRKYYDEGYIKSFMSILFDHKGDSISPYFYRTLIYTIVENDNVFDNAKMSNLYVDLMFIEEAIKHLISIGDNQVDNLLEESINKITITKAFQLISFSNSHPYIETDLISTWISRFMREYIECDRNIFALDNEEVKELLIQLLRYEATHQEFYDYLIKLLDSEANLHIFLELFNISDYMKGKHRHFDNDAILFLARTRIFAELENSKPSDPELNQKLSALIRWGKELRDNADQ